MESNERYAGCNTGRNRYKRHSMAGYTWLGADRTLCCCRSQNLEIQFPLISVYRSATAIDQKEKISMYCKDCGAKNDMDAKFCTNCGASGGVPAVATPAGYRPVVYSPAPTSKPKNKIILVAVVVIAIVVIYFVTQGGGGTDTSYGGSMERQIAGRWYEVGIYDNGEWFLLGGDHGAFFLEFEYGGAYFSGGVTRRDGVEHISIVDYHGSWYISGGELRVYLDEFYNYVARFSIQDSTLRLYFLQNLGRPVEDFGQVGVFSRTPPWQ